MPSMRMKTHKNQCGIQIFIVLLLKVSVVFFHFSLELAVELHSGIGSKRSRQWAAGGNGYGGAGTGVHSGCSGGSMRDCTSMAQTTTYIICLSESCTTLESGSGVGTGVASVGKVLRGTVVVNGIPWRRFECICPLILGAHSQRQWLCCCRKDP